MRQKRNYRKEVRVGILITLGLVIVIGAVFSVGGGKDSLFGKKVKYTIFFDSTGGLYKGDPVLLTGVEVGNVVDISFPENIKTRKIKVVIEISKNAARRVRTDSRAVIAAASIVYGKVIELSMGDHENPPIQPGEEIKTGTYSGFGSLVSSTTSVMDDMRVLLNKISKGDGALGMIVNEQLKVKEMMNNLNRASASLAVLLHRAQEGKGSIGTLLADSSKTDETINDIQAAAKNLREVSENLKSKKTLFGKLVNDKDYGKKIAADLELLMHSLANISTKMDTGNGSAAMLINDGRLYRGMEDVVFGIKRSSIATWFIRNRRKAGEKTRPVTPFKKNN
ncbi:MCE family protein [bacterium]|nr:MCE family protein [bacterium]